MRCGVDGRRLLAAVGRGRRRGRTESVTDNVAVFGVAVGAGDGRVCFVSGQQAGTLSFAVPRSPGRRTDPIPMSSRDSPLCPPAAFIRSSSFSLLLVRL